VEEGAQDNTVGGDTPGERNVISGNGYEGVTIIDSGTTGNTVSGNYIGIDASGTTDLGNDGSGVGLWYGSHDNTIGGSTPGERNIISGNTGQGVMIMQSGTNGNTVSGNYIGTDASGTSSMGNGSYGVLITEYAQNNTVGGDETGERNIISGNYSNGVYITFAQNNTVSGNYIGTDATGTIDLGNVENGVSIQEEAHDNTIGGGTDGERNVISGNGLNGVEIIGSGADYNTISGNFIGTDAGGNVDLGNDGDGVYIGAAYYNTIGGSEDGERNVISGNSNGVTLDYEAKRNTVSGNYIGVGANGTSDLGNDEDGVVISNSSKDNTIGGDTTSERNVISHNKKMGVRIIDSGTEYNKVSGNYIGTDPNGTTDQGNSEDGVYIDNGAQNNTVGPDNMIAYNGRDGVRVNGSTTMGNVITENSIFSNSDGINLLGGANGDIPTALIIATTLGSVNITGTACPHCTVELFENSDTDGEGETFIGSTVADFSGIFTLTVPHLGSPYLTATATDIRGTSEFPNVFTSLLRFLFLPQIYKNY
jgi:titin